MRRRAYDGSHVEPPQAPGRIPSPPRAAARAPGRRIAVVDAEEAHRKERERRLRDRTLAHHATVIQRAWRAVRAARMQARREQATGRIAGWYRRLRDRHAMRTTLAHLATLRAIEARADDLHAQHRPALCAGRAAGTALLAYSELLVRLLLELDSVASGDSGLVRTRRRSIATRINALLDEAERAKDTGARPEVADTAETIGSETMSDAPADAALLTDGPTNDTPTEPESTGLDEIACGCRSRMQVDVESASEPEQ